MRQIIRGGLAALALFMGTMAMAQAPANVPGTARIVSLNGSNTEVLFALGVGEQVVGRDDSAIYPPEVSKVPSIGYQYKLSAEGILSKNPTLVIGRTDVKPPEVVQQLKAAGVAVELIEEPTSLDEARARITRLGTMVDREQKAAELNAALDSDIKKFEARRAELGDAAKKKALFIYLRGPKTKFVLGEKTNPGSMLKLVGAENAMPTVKDMAPVSAEAFVAAQPEVIVTFTHGMGSVGGIDGLLNLPGVAQTPAGKNKRIIIMDDLYLGGFTNRAGKAALDLLNALQADGITNVKGR